MILSKEKRGRRAAGLNPAVFVSAALVLALTSCSSARAYDDTLFSEVGDGPIGPFSLIERSGRTVSQGDLSGRIWVVNFFFTTCTGGCPKTTGAMARLQEHLAGYPDVVLVSITVYPLQDTPERLRAYADSWKADSERWLFLTGPETAVYELIDKTFAQTAKKKEHPKPGDEIDHTFSLMVVDHRGRIRGYVDGLKPEEVDRLEARVKELVQAKYLPTVNASLNATCACLLVIGFVAIKRRLITLHKVCMLTALGVSIVFLTCYLYYHLVILRGQHTPFPEDTGIMKSVYRVILGSHIVLAAIIAPLALYTAYLGLRGRLVHHVRFARWTLPLWLYVSVTGVIVYVLLYHLYPPA